MSSRKVFVVGAHIGRAGARMAHWVGRVASEAFGFELICVEAWDDTSGPRMFGDPAIPITIRAADVAAIATPHDLLICNPSFSELGLGRAFPGRSICYVQGLRTFELLDTFTHYVSVSSAAAGYLSLIYGIETRVIPPFLTVPSELSRQGWVDKASSILVIVKQGGELHRMVLEDTVLSIESTCPGLPVIITTGNALTQREFLRQLSEHKFVLAFSPQEGFGLAPLEAMACGAVVLGLNGVGGRDYMIPGDNCLTVEWVDHNKIAALTAQAFNDPALCERISDAAIQTASRFTLERFRASWRAEIENVLAWIFDPCRRPATHVANGPKPTTLAGIHADRKLWMRMSNRRVFVVAAHHPTGGARMAHWIGRIAAESFGFELINAVVRDTPSGPLLFGDSEISQSIPVGDVCATATPDDLLICNPVFSSFGLGRNFPGRSISYVQGIRTFELLDKFTHYVSVSVAAADCLSAVYGIKTRVIPRSTALFPRRYAAGDGSTRKTPSW